MIDDKLFDDFVKFHNEQIYSQDCDPIYPVLKYIGADYSRREQVWLTFLHVSFYHIGSALLVYSDYTLPDIRIFSLAKNPTGTERRGHRDPKKLVTHWEHLIQIDRKYNGLDRWLDQFIEEDPKKNWEILNEVLQTIYGNGRWAAYKTGEMLMKINDYPLQPTDMGHRNSSGPRHGLSLFFDQLPNGQSDEDIVLLDLKSESLVEEMRSKGANVSIETAETSLCDFNSMYKGRYYSGYDIDMMQTQLLKVPSRLTLKAFEARKATIPNEYLGELNGWIGVRKEKNNEYRKSRNNN